MDEKNKFQDSLGYENDTTISRIREIYENYSNTQEFNKILACNRFDIDWLLESLDHETFQKLEDYVLSYCSRNDELLFQLGFQYAWSLFTECMNQEPFHPVQTI